MRILITGASGFIGNALITGLSGNDKETVALPRGSYGAGELGWNPVRGEIDLAGQTFEAVINLSGKSIASGHWTAAIKDEILSSRVQATKLLCEHLAGLEHKPAVLINASAVGFYGDQGDKQLDETSSSGSDFLADVCQQWEDATKLSADAGIRVVNARFGVVLGREGGALKQMLLPFKLGFGGVIGPGTQYMSWISITDVVKAIAFILDQSDLSGPVNLVSPNPVTNRQFTKALARTLHRPALLPVPTFAARLFLGEMADELLLASTRVTPAKLLQAGYEFSQPDLGDALETIWNVHSGAL